MADPRAGVVCEERSELNFCLKQLCSQLTALEEGSSAGDGGAQSRAHSANQLGPGPGLGPGPRLGLGPRPGLGWG